jgi:hypothetical protein
MFREFSETMSEQSEMNDPSYWQRRAQETRRLASRTQDHVDKDALLEIAKTYEAISALAQTRHIAKS